MWHACGEVHATIWWRNVKEAGHLKGLGIDGREILKGSPWWWDEKDWTGFVWVRLGTKWRTVVSAVIS
jgi:hypothetical protein